MIIRLQSLFGLDMIKAFGGDEVALQADKMKLMDFLQELSRQSGSTIKLIDLNTGDVVNEYFVLVNGCDYQSLLHGLNTELHDGDEVAIGPVDLVFSGG